MRYFLYGLLGIVGLVGIGVGMNYLSTLSKVATAPSRVINRTMDTDNIISNYEWFHDVHAAFQAKLGQVKTHKSLVSTSEGAEKSRLNMELAAMRQKCRELVTRYNANSIKTNRSIFKGKTAPEELDLAYCEG